MLGASDRRLLALGGDLVRVRLAVEAVRLGRAPDAHEPRHLAALLGREEALLRRRQGAAVRAVPDDLGVVPACVFGGASTASTPWTPVSWDIFVIQRSYARPPPTTRTVPPNATVENLGR